MAAAPPPLSGRRQIHRYINVLLARPRPSPLPPPPQSATGVAVPPVFRSGSGSTSSKRRKKSQENNDGSCRIVRKRIVDDYSEEEVDEEFLCRDSVHQREQASHEPASAVAAAVAPEEVMLLDEDEEEVEIEGNNVEDSESQSEDQVDDADDDEEFTEEDDNEDVGSDSSVHEQEESKREHASAVVAAPVAPPPVCVWTRTAVANVTVCDADAMECAVCFLALRPPIFQCELGHVVCSACRDKLEATGNGKCHVCGVATRGGYHRCHAMENLVDCILVPCPYKAHGCDATPPYHGLESHRQLCQHAPCHCPGESCGFIGSTLALLDHFSGAHNWPCTTKVRAGETFSIRLRGGFNFFLLEDHGRSDGEKAAATGSVLCRLFLLNMMQERLGRAISVLCIHSHATNGAQQLPPTQCELVFSRYGNGSSCRSHYQSSVFDVVSTDLSSGLPNPESCFQFIVPNAVFGDDDKNSFHVKARIIN